MSHIEVRDGHAPRPCVRTSAGTRLQQNSLPSTVSCWVHQQRPRHPVPPPPPSKTARQTSAPTPAQIIRLTRQLTWGANVLHGVVVPHGTGRPGLLINNRCDALGCPVPDIHCKRTEITTTHAHMLLLTPALKYVREYSRCKNVVNQRVLSSGIRMRTRLGTRSHPFGTRPPTSSAQRPSHE